MGNTVKARNGNVLNTEYVIWYSPVDLSCQRYEKVSTLKKPNDKRIFYKFQNTSQATLELTLDHIKKLHAPVSKDKNDCYGSMEIDGERKWISKREHLAEMLQGSDFETNGKKVEEMEAFWLANKVAPLLWELNAKQLDAAMETTQLDSAFRETTKKLLFDLSSNSDEEEAVKLQAVTLLANWKNEDLITLQDVLNYAIEEMQMQQRLAEEEQQRKKQQQQQTILEPYVTPASQYFLKISSGYQSYNQRTEPRRLRRRSGSTSKRARTGIAQAA